MTEKDKWLKAMDEDVAPYQPMAEKQKRWIRRLRRAILQRKLERIPLYPRWIKEPL